MKRHSTVNSFGWANAPALARETVEAVQRALRQALGGNLVGMHLHGSLALGCFNPKRSDVDLLACIDEGMAVETKRAVALSLLSLSATPYPIEISFVRLQDVRPWQFPTPFDFHYSEMWRTCYEAELTSGAWRTWNQRPIRRDADLAAHITVVRARGVTLFGPPAGQIFAPVPSADYLTAILDDCKAASEHILAEPVYGVLTLCRVYAYIREGHVYSKDEAGVWASGLLPLPFGRTAQGALAAYRGEVRDDQFTPEGLSAFAAYLDSLICSTSPKALPST
jgi:hypothetical protein